MSACKLGYLHIRRIYKIRSHRPMRAGRRFDKRGSLGKRFMPYFVSWKKDEHVRRFAYPHVDLKTALAFACEVLDMEDSEVWVSDETGQKVADRAAIMQYAEEHYAEDMEDMDES